MIEEITEQQTPDWPAELLEPVSKLGPPLDAFRIQIRHAARKTISGISLVVGGLFANYVYWFILDGPGDIHILHFLLFSPIATGLGLLYAAWRDRGLWVLVYPMGLLRWQRGTVLTFPWEELVDLSFFRVVECDRPRRTTGPNGEILTSWLPIAKMGSRTLGAHLILRREDGAEAILPSSLEGFTRLCQIVQEETFRIFWPQVWARFCEGKRVKFGEVSLSLGGLHREGDFLPWNEIDDALVLNGKLVIRSRVLRKPWAEVQLHNVMNPHVFVALLIIGPPIVVDSDPKISREIEVRSSGDSQ